MTNSTDDAIRAYCDARGWRFKPWEVHPADAASDACPWPPSTAAAASWSKARALRARILADLGLTDGD